NRSGSHQHRGRSAGGLGNRTYRQVLESHRATAVGGLGRGSPARGADGSDAMGRSGAVRETVAVVFRAKLPHADVDFGSRERGSGRSALPGASGAKSTGGVPAMGGRSAERTSGRTGSGSGVAPVVFGLPNS